MNTSAARVFRHTGHRPWPLPEGRWIMFQSWCDLLFAHWPVPHAELRRHVPSQLELEEHAGSAWIGLTPFRLEQLRPPWLPAAPVLSSFPEVNLRTYVKVGRKPGIFFFSLDVASRLTVLGARMFYRLPYHLAQMQVGKTGEGAIAYWSRRGSGEAVLNAHYRPLGQPFSAREGTLEHFLVERYALFAVTRSGTVLQGDIHHGPWAIQEAEATIRRNTIAAASGVHIPETSPLLHFAARQDTVIWPPRQVR